MFIKKMAEGKVIGLNQFRELARQLEKIVLPNDSCTISCIPAEQQFRALIACAEENETINLAFTIPIAYVVRQGLPAPRSNVDCSYAIPADE